MARLSSTMPTRANRRSVANSCLSMAYSRAVCLSQSSKSSSVCRYVCCTRRKARGWLAFDPQGGLNRGPLHVPANDLFDLWLQGAVALGHSQREFEVAAVDGAHFIRNRRRALATGGF